jgi:hypothetical protein
VGTTTDHNISDTVFLAPTGDRLKIITLQEVYLFFVRTLTQATAAPCSIPKSLHSLNGINVTAIWAVNLFANLWLDVSATPPFTTAIAMKVKEKF